MDMLARTVARNLQLSLHVVRSVTVTAVHGRDIAQPEPRGYSVVMDDIERGATVSVLASVALDRRPAGQYRIIRATLTYEDCVTGASRRAEADVVLEITDDRAKLSSPVNPKVTSQLQLVRAAHDLDRTMAAVRANDLDVTQAIQNLERTQTLLVSQGLGKDAAGITQAIDMVASGGSLEKTLMGAIIDLEKGKRT
jgi:Ca-activated chloride channel family protein